MRHISKFSFGAIYTENGAKIDSSVRIGGTYGDKVLDCSPSFFKLNSYKKIFKGKTIYIGPFMGHYGHFITEGLSRLSLLNHQDFDNVVCSPFIFTNKLSSFHKELLNLFGIEKLQVLDETSFFEEIWIPEQLWSINTKPKLGLKRIYDFIKRSYMDKFEKKHTQYNICLSDKNKDSRIKNKSDVEKLFEHNGFMIIYPENLSFEEQIYYYLHAKTFVCFSGTLAHNALFCNEDSVNILEIGDMRSKNRPIPMQEYIYELGSLKYKFVPYQGDKDGNISIGYLKKTIEELKR